MLLGQSKWLNCNEILGHVTDWNNIAIIDSLSIHKNEQTYVDCKFNCVRPEGIITYFKTVKFKRSISK